MKVMNTYQTPPSCGSLQRCIRMEPGGFATVNQKPDSAFLQPDWTQPERWSDGEPIRCLCLLLTGLYPVGLYRLCAAVIYRSRGEEDEYRGWEEGENPGGNALADRGGGRATARNVHIEPTFISRDN